MKKIYLCLLVLLSLNSCDSLNNTTNNSGENEINSIDMYNNKPLVRSLKKYNRRANDKNYSAVVQELVNGLSTLYLPEAFEHRKFSDPSEIQFAIINKDGLKIITAFTSKENFFKWTNEDAPYVTIKSRDLEELSRQNSIFRILIDPEQTTFFVLEKDTGREKVIIQDNAVKIGPAENFLSANDLNSLSIKFSEVQPILEAYGFKMLRDDKITFVIGFVLRNYSEDSQQACFNAVQSAIDFENSELPVELFMFERNDSILNTVQKDENSLIYRR